MHNFKFLTAIANYTNLQLCISRGQLQIYPFIKIDSIIKSSHYFQIQNSRIHLVAMGKYIAF